jgi:uncharacterized protein (TIGR00730 family)
MTSPPEPAVPVSREAKRKRTRAQRLIKRIDATLRALEAGAASIGDLKLTARSLEEMQAAFELFAPYRDTRKVATFGSARTQEDDAIFRTAEQFARAIADAGFMVITGAGGGIMEAAQRGAGRERSFGVNIRLPFEQAPNPFIDGDVKLLMFNYFFTRKLFFTKEAHAVALFPGGFGTLDEGFEILTLLQTGKCQPLPLVLLDQPRGTYWRTWHRYVEDHLLRRSLISTEDLALYRVTDDCDEAVREITNYYRVYHSARYVKDHLVLRLQRALPPDRLTELGTEFADICEDGTLTPCNPFPAERDDPATMHLPRVCFRFNRRNFGRLRMLIDRINATP